MLFPIHTLLCPQQFWTKIPCNTSIFLCECSFRSKRHCDQERAMKILSYLSYLSRFGFTAVDGVSLSLCLDKSLISLWHAWDKRQVASSTDFSQSRHLKQTHLFQTPILWFLAIAVFAGAQGQTWGSPSASKRELVTGMALATFIAWSILSPSLSLSWLSYFLGVF